MSEVSHLGFIVAAYGVTALVLIATVAVLLADHRAQRRLMHRFDTSDRGTTS